MNILIAESETVCPKVLGSLKSLQQSYPRLSTRHEFAAKLDVDQNSAVGFNPSWMRSIASATVFACLAVYRTYAQDRQNRLSGRQAPVPHSDPAVLRFPEAREAAALGYDMTCCLGRQILQLYATDANDPTPTSDVHNISTLAPLLRRSKWRFDPH